MTHNEYAGEPNEDIQEIRSCRPTRSQHKNLYHEPRSACRNCYIILYLRVFVLLHTGNQMATQRGVSVGCN